MIQTTLKIDGMMCGMCESHINDCIRSNFKVKKVSSSHAKGQCVIQSEAPLDQEKLRSVIAATGYTLTEISQGDAQEPKKKGFLGLFRK